MTPPRFQFGVLLLWVVAFAQSAPCEGLLITCTTPDTCEFKAVAALTINGRSGVRMVLAKGLDSVTISVLRASRETRIDGLPGIMRDPTSGLVYASSASGVAQAMVFPGGAVPKEAAAIPTLWVSAHIAYRETLRAKDNYPIAAQAFAGFFVGRDLPAITVTYAQYLVAAPPTARRAGLLRGALQFAGGTASYKAWEEQLATASRNALARYRKQEGDPRRLADALSSAIRDAAILVEIAPAESTYATLLADARSEQSVLTTKVAIAKALAAGNFWDEYVLKVNELGLTKWSLPDLVPVERTALAEAANAHRAKAEQLGKSGFLDRAFDEAELAYRRNPCSADATIYFTSIRPQFVERNKDPRQFTDSGGNRPELQQLERQLRSLDAAQLQQESYRKLGYELITRGDAIDRTYAPFQLAKAQFFRNLHDLSSALDVVTDVERHLALDSRQRDQWLSLDASLSLAISATRDKALADAKADIDAGHFREALDATMIGLAADPYNPLLLLQRALAAASLREPEQALQAIHTLLKASNAACADAGVYEKALALRDALETVPPGNVAAQNPDTGDGVPNWISGKKYVPGRLYYDPVSLSFVPRIAFVNGIKRPPTVTIFTWDGLRLVSIETKANPTTAGKENTGQTIFYVEPEYAPGTLRMTSIGPRAIQEGKRVSYPLTFWNDPKVNVGLLQSNGRTAARGWSGNPVFDPYIWIGIYLFDFKYDEKGRVIQATPVPDETRGRSFSEPLTIVWDDATGRLKSIKSASYQRTMEYDNKGRLVAEVATFRKAKARTSYRYAGESFIPRQVTSSSVFDQQQRSAIFQASN